MMQPTLSDFDSTGACGEGVQAKSWNRQKNIVSIDVTVECFFIVTHILIYA